MPFLAKDEGRQLVISDRPHINFLTKPSESLPSIKGRRKGSKQLGYFLSRDIFYQHCNSTGLTEGTDVLGRVQKHPGFTFCAEHKPREGR